MPTRTKEINEENNEKTTKKKATTKKTTQAVAKKSTTKTTTTATKKAAVKKSADKKATTTTKKSTIAKKAAAKKLATTKTKPVAEVVEYYDLPYRYNETVVKILYQTPETLFVYWDIADSDRENYIKQYGENFFNITRPVLIIHNDTMNYSFEIPINDFANSWYFNINDSKCHYRVELGRRPNYYSQEAAKEIAENIKTDYIYVTSSNKIESPNDRVLFNTNENNTIRFRNIKNNEEKSISLYDVIKRLPVMKKFENIPYISEELLKNLYAGIYQNEDIYLFERLTNPSSGGNPSSGSMSSRFM
ncbi:MAG: DUF4912 domain-containing protein [Clostridia bacterium]|nr:DUF4912 domain-containing protein [Clostridia bacterium]